jgi:hypothetical protein
MSQFTSFTNQSANGRQELIPAGTCYSVKITNSTRNSLPYFKNKTIFFRCETNYVASAVVVNSVITGANPTIASYNASVVNFYNATDNLARFENKNIFF